MNQQYLRFCSWLLALFSLSSCCYPCGDFDVVCQTCQNSKKKKQHACAFVPLYSDDEINQNLVNTYDSKAEQLYKTSSSTVAFRNITFATDSYTIKGEENLAILSSLVRHMQKSPKITLYIEGHTDERGAASYNLALGTRIANAVKQHLIKQGISPERLFTISYGQKRPICLSHTDLAWQQNRRTAFKVHGR